MCARPARARATTQLRLKPWPERRELCLLAVSGSPAARSLQAAGRGNMIEMDAEAAAQPPPLQPSPSLSLPLPFLFLSPPSPPPLPPSGPWIREASLYVKFSKKSQNSGTGAIWHRSLDLERGTLLTFFSFLSLLPPNSGPSGNACSADDDDARWGRRRQRQRQTTKWPAGAPPGRLRPVRA